MTTNIDEIKSKISNIIDILPTINNLSGEIISLHIPYQAILNQKILNEIAKEIALIRQFNIQLVIILDSKHNQNEFESLKSNNKNIDNLIKGLLTLKYANTLSCELNNIGVSSMTLNCNEGKLANISQDSEILMNKSTGIHEIKISKNKIEDINIEILNQLSETDVLPILVPFAWNQENNIQFCDSIDLASKIAQKLEANKLIIGTHQKGIQDKDGNLITAINVNDLKKIERTPENESIIKSTIEALSNQIKSIHIIDMTDEYSLLIEVFSKQGIGTMIYNS